jgi:hypothetical protein
VNGVSTLLRLGSRVACAIVLVSFALFAIDQAGSASAQQQNEVNESAPAGTAGAGAKPKSTATAKKGEGGAREAVDEASSTITSPFAGAVAGVHNEWASRGVRLLLALLVYGFGLGYLARVLRVRV